MPVLANRIDFMIQSSHGVYLPPRKKKNRPKALTMRFVLTGTIPSKKNRQIATMNWKRILKAISGILSKSGGSIKMKEIVAVFKENKPYVRQSEDFRKWNDEAKAIILSQAQKWSRSLEKHNMIFPVRVASVSIYHYWKDNLVRDNSNKAETIHDLLVDAGVISGDSWQQLNPIKAEADIYRHEIKDHITVIDLTAYEW